MDYVRLPELVDELLTRARAASSGRAQRALTGANSKNLRQIVFALAADRELSEHENPGDATLQLLRGRATLTTTSETQELSAGMHVVLPHERHGLVALEESVALLTISSR